MTAIRVFAALSLAWAAVALAVQVVVARGGGRRDYSRPSGDARRGVLYNLTVAMLPAHKETARLHRMEFAAGVVMHAGVISGIVAVILLLVWPAGGLRLVSVLGPVSALSLVAGIGLLVRRILSPNLRRLSAPEDYMAIAASCGFLASAVVQAATGRYESAFLLYAGLLFAYLPLGKLRHAVFFFVARVDLGGRLGRRGVYPPVKAGME